ncbi:MAG: AAA family ATPase [Lachnospiraceae bacterium]|nr:AAA family ATPase [Lachnospiraceae bacterium]
MLYYNMRIKYTEPENSSEIKDDDTDRQEMRITKFNAALRSRSGDKSLYAFMYNIEEGFAEVGIILSPEKHTVQSVGKKVLSLVKRIFGAGDPRIEKVSETTPKNFTAMLDNTESSEPFTRFSFYIVRELSLDYFENCFFKVNEKVPEEKKLTKKAALSLAEGIMGDRSLIEELDRIYDPANSRTYQGFPVHYKIRAEDVSLAEPMVELLVRMLKANNRIPGSRITYITDIESGCYDEEELEHACMNANGSAVVIEMRGETEDSEQKNSFGAVIRYITQLVKRYNKNTLFIFLEISEESTFSRGLLSNVTEVVDLVEINEGTGDRANAVNYLKCLAANSEKAKYLDESIVEYLPDKKIFKAGDVLKAYSKWEREVLKKRAYSAYKGCSVTTVSKEIQKHDAYETLKSLVGLEKIKTLADRMIYSYKMQKLRAHYGLDTGNASRHMIFTGNPGSAKTTVARLLAEILADEGILKTGIFVECGRSDLVGKYVGWTAPAVKKKFMEATGGILFIDEAYSLVDDRSNSYGDEAINAIVQEMENKRDSVIVVFAGYPEKMEAFLERNEGLKSRIAFYLDFPDYGAGELMDIMELMLKNKGLKVNAEARKRCLEIFKKVCNEKEFGNGRFVRNLIEQAMLHQAERIMSKYSGKEVPKSQVELLIAEDFDMDFRSICNKTKRRDIGFVA